MGEAGRRFARLGSLAERPEDLSSPQRHTLSRAPESQGSAASAGQVQVQIPHGVRMERDITSIPDVDESQRVRQRGCDSWAGLRGRAAGPSKMT